jgi:GTP cyclohydrolase IA
MCTHELEPRGNTFSDTVTSVEEILVDLGYTTYDGEPDENFTLTPQRWASWLVDFAQRNVEEEVRDVLSPVFPEAHEELVIVRDIEFTALCAHHVLPFVGRAHVGYVPRKGVVGLSKIARAVKLVARQLTLQERITRIVADSIYEVLGCQGVMVVVEATHMCMSFRGVEDTHVSTTTSAVRGIFETDKDGIKTEFLQLIGRR